MVEGLLPIELTPNSSNVVRKNMLFQTTKKLTKERQDFGLELLNQTSETFPVEFNVNNSPFPF